jgi:hypothetical protein
MTERLNRRSKHRFPRKKFSADDDAKLRSLVQKHGYNQWALVAKEMEKFTPRQVRERWKHYLSSSYQDIEWTKQEDEALLQKVREIGLRWTRVTLYFPGRSDIQVKSRYFYIKERSEREIRNEKSSQFLFEVDDDVGIFGSFSDLFHCDANCERNRFLAIFTSLS